MSFWNLIADSALGLMTVYVSVAVNPTTAIHEATVLHFDRKAVLKYDYGIFLHYARDRSSSLKLIRDEEHVKWAAEPLCVQYAMYIDGKFVAIGQEIVLIKIPNISTVIMNRKSSLTDTVQNTLS